MKPATSKRCRGLPRPIIKFHAEEKWAWPWAQLSKISEFLFNIYATADASDFKFGMQLAKPKGHHKITPRGNVGWAVQLYSPYR